MTAEDLILVERGERRCLTCGRRHDSYGVPGSDAAPSWTDRADGHPYRPEPWEAIARRARSRIAALIDALIISHAEGHGRRFGDCTHGRCRRSMRNDETLPKVDSGDTQYDYEAAVARETALLADIQERVRTAVEELPGLGGRGVGYGANDEAVVTPSPLISRAAVLAVIEREIG